jgi:hypothetical protein
VLSFCSQRISAVPQRTLSRSDFSQDPANLYYEMVTPCSSGSGGGGTTTSSGCGGDSSNGGSASSGGGLRPSVAAGRAVDLSAMPAPAFCACHGGGGGPLQPWAGVGAGAGAGVRAAPKL